MVTYKIRSGEEKYHIVVNKSGANSMMNSNPGDQSSKNKMEPHHNVLANYQNFFQSQQQNYHLVQHNNQQQQQHQQVNRQNSHPKGASNNNNVNGTAVNSHNAKVISIHFLSD